MNRVPKIVLIIAYAAGLALFYYKYVPLVELFQLALAPVLLTTAFLAWRNLRAGTLLFVFLFPLINNLPYFFGIHEPSPLAPTALVLFLFYFFGVLLRRNPLGDDGPVKGRAFAAEVDPRAKPGAPAAGDDDPVDPVVADVADGPVVAAVARPIVLFCLLVGVSALLTFLRYANYFPFLNSEIYERAVNRQGLKAGGAIMSVVFQALSYLSGCAFFIVAARLLRSKKFRRQVMLALGLASLLSLGFAAVQHFGLPALGNNPASIGLGLINGTFKDALSFGAFLAMAVPLFLGVFFAARDIRLKALSLVVVALSLLALPFTGSKSGIIGLAFALLVFIVLGARNGFPARRRAKSVAPSKRRRLATAAVLTCAALLALVFVVPRLKNSNIVRRFENSKDMLGVRLALLWKPALRMMAEYPLTGVGMGAFIVEVVHYAVPYERPDVIPESAENYALQVGSELGLIGLGLVAWIFWEILRRIRKGLNRKTEDGGEPFLLIGAAAAGAAFVVAAQAHSFIGSYEIQYAFWLMVALIFAVTCDRPGEDPVAPRPAVPRAVSGENSAGRPRSWRKFRIAAAALLILYAAVHLWNSTHSLSLESRTAQFGISREFGLYKAELTADDEIFRWTREYAGFPLQVKKAEIVIPIHASHPDIREKPVEVKVYLMRRLFERKRLLKTIILSGSLWRDVEISLPDEVSHEVFLLITVGRTWNPLKTTGVPDPRNLGVAIGEIEFKEKK